MNNDELQFFLLNYTHQKLEELLHKLDENMMLTQEQYDKLINKIGLDNISTFSGNYYDLTNTPLIPTKTSQLMNNSGLLDLYHYEELNEQLIAILNRIGELEPRVEELEAIPDIILEVNEIEERIANIQEDIVYLQEFCTDYKIDFENLYDITMEIKEVNDTLEDRLIYTNEKINLCTDLIDLNTTDVSTISDLIQEINSQIDSLKIAKEELASRADRAEEAMTALDTVNLKQQLENLQHQFENTALDKYATEETVVAFLDKANQVYQEYSKLVQDTNQLEKRVTALAEANTGTQNRMQIIQNDIEQNITDIVSIKNTLVILEKTINSLSDVDLTLLEELNLKAETLEQNLLNIQNQISKIELLDFVTDDEIEELQSKIDNNIYEINQSINAMNLDLLRLTQINHDNFVTNERMVKLESDCDLHITKANAEINEIKTKLSKFGNLNIDNIATIAYVDNRATEFMNEITNSNKRIDAVIYRVTVLEAIDMDNYVTKTLFENTINNTKKQFETEMNALVQEFENKINDLTEELNNLKQSPNNPGNA